MKFLELFLGEIESIPEIRIVLLSDKIEEAVKDQILFLLIIYGEDWIDTNLPDRIGFEANSVVGRRRRAFNVVGKWLGKIWMIFIRVERPVKFAYLKWVWKRVKIANN